MFLMGRTLAPPGEYDGPVYAATVLQPDATGYYLLSKMASVIRVCYAA